MRRWLTGTITLFRWELVIITAGLGVGLGLAIAHRADASPLSVHAHQSNLYGGTRAEVRVYATVRAFKPSKATILAEALDTSHGNWGAAEGTGIAHVRLHKGLNRIHRTLTVERLEQRYCFWRPEHRAEHPECPFLTSYHHDPYVGVAAVFDRVLVTVSVGGKPLAERVGSVHQLNGAALPEEPAPGH